MKTQHVNDQYSVNYIRNEMITIVRDGVLVNSFLIGDWAEYDSYNLSYHGIIRSITDKTVTIEAYPDTQIAKKHRLKLDTFCWRNWNFNKAKSDAENYDTMMYI